MIVVVVGDQDQIDAGQVLDALMAITAPLHRKVMLGFAVDQLRGASTPSGLDALAALLGGSVPGVEVLHVG
ncbi:MAG: hypothetical protein Q8R16_00560 [bacterium]|nr:hypothetical protein [bacterium]